MTDPSIQRRAVLRNLMAGGAVLGGGSVLAGCGGDDSGADLEAPSTGPDDTQQERSEENSAKENGEPLASVDDVPEGSGVILADQHVVLTQPEPGEFLGFSSVCTHAGCDVDSISGTTIECPCHGSQYDITDGSVINGPASEPLPKVNITVSGKNIARA